MRLSTALVGVAVLFLVLSRYQATARAVRPHKSWGFKQPNFGFHNVIESARETLHAERAKRQAPGPDCIAVITAAPQQCIQDFEGDFRDLSNETIHAFCTSHCPMLINNYFRKVRKSCGAGFAPDNQTLISVERALNESCKQDFKHEYCLQDWRDFNSTFSHTSWATKGQDCIDSAKATKDCSSSCKEVVDYIKSHYGCCFASQVNLLDRDTAQSITSLEKRCGYNAKPCPSKQKAQEFLQKAV